MNIVCRINLVSEEMRSLHLRQVYRSQLPGDLPQLSQLVGRIGGMTSLIHAAVVACDVDICNAPRGPTPRTLWWS